MLTDKNFKRYGFLKVCLVTHNKKSYVNRKTNQVIVYTFQNNKFLSNLKDKGELEINSCLFKNVFKSNDLKNILNKFVGVIKEEKIFTEKLNYEIRMNAKGENIITVKN